MSRIKRVFGFTLCAVILVVFGALPALVGNIQDAFAIGREEEIAISKVSLTVQRRTNLENLLLISSRDNSLIYITPEDANLSKEEIAAAVDRELEPYLSAGLIDRDVLAKNIRRTYEAYASVANGDSGITGTLWYVTFAEEDWAINLYLDDQEGKLLFINYECGDYFYSGDYKDQEMAIECLDAFEEVYFRNLELFEQVEYIDKNVAPVETVPLKDGSVARWYSLGDEKYGEISVELEFTPGGFFLHFP